MLDFDRSERNGFCFSRVFSRKFDFAQPFLPPHGLTGLVCSVNSRQLSVPRPCFLAAWISHFWEHVTTSHVFTHHLTSVLSGFSLWYTPRTKSIACIQADVSLLENSTFSHLLPSLVSYYTMMMHYSKLSSSDKLWRTLWLHAGVGEWCDLGKRWLGWRRAPTVPGYAARACVWLDAPLRYISGVHSGG